MAQERKVEAQRVDITAPPPLLAPFRERRTIGQRRRAVIRLAYRGRQRLGIALRGVRRSRG
jgi:hypothetical protein